MTQKGQRHLLFFNASAVVCYADKGNPAFLYFYSNGSSSCIHSIFYQFLYHRGRALYHFPCRNFINRILV